MKYKNFLKLKMQVACSVRLYRAKKWPWTELGAYLNNSVLINLGFG